MDQPPITLSDAARRLLLREATRQADYHHDHHCARHTQSGWDTPATGQSAGCHLWSAIQGWAEQPSIEPLKIILGEYVRAVPVVLSPVNNEENAP